MINENRTLERVALEAVSLLPWRAGARAACNRSRSFLLETWGARFPELRFGRGFFGPRRLRNSRCTGTRSANSFSSFDTVVARLRLSSGHRAAGTASIIPG